MRHILLGLSLLLSPQLWLMPTGAAAADRPNVLFIILECFTA